jgi:hypothetical protein
VPASSDPGFTRFFLAGVFFRAVLGVAAMLFGVGGVTLGRLSTWSWAPFVGGCLGLLIGVAVARGLKTRWDPLTRTAIGPNA